MNNYKKTTPHCDTACVHYNNCKGYTGDKCYNYCDGYCAPEDYTRPANPIDGYVRPIEDLELALEYAEITQAHDCTIEERVAGKCATCTQQCNWAGYVTPKDLYDNTDDLDDVIEDEDLPFN